MEMEEIKLLSAKEAGEILGINANAVYDLWKKNLLDYWCLHGTKKTNLTAIADFLERTKNTEIQA